VGNRPEDVQQLLEASLRELGEVSTNEGVTDEFVGSTADLMRALEDQRRQIEVSFAQFNAGIRAGFQRLRPSEKARFIRQLVASGKTQQRIATLLGVTQSAVSQHLARSRKKTSGHVALIARIEDVLDAGGSAEAVSLMLREMGVEVNAASVTAFMEVYRKLTTVED
jgi:predicted transcriptional regulator